MSKKTKNDQKDLTESNDKTLDKGLCDLATSKNDADHEKASSSELKQIKEDVKDLSKITLPPEEFDRLMDEIIAGIKTVYDPEIPADIYELGLIYRIDVSDERFVTVDMTLTAPGCPVAGEMPGWVENAVLSVPGISGCKVVMTFDPPWDQSRMSDLARYALDIW